MITGPGDDSTAAQKVLFAVGREQRLAVLSPVLSEALTWCDDPDQLGAIIAMSPGLTLALLTMTGATRQRGGSLSVERLTRGMKSRVIRSLLLQADLYGDGDNADGFDGSMVLARQDLILHSVAVAVCARKIAETEQGRSAGELAYLAGLFHDCGKLALEQALPKGYAQVREQAEVDHCGILHAERFSLGTDHAVLGKRLTEQWGLPPAVVHAAWLHHTPLVQQLVRVPGHEVAHWVRLANMLVKDVDRELETSASFAQLLDWPTDRIAQIREYLDEQMPAVQAVVMRDYTEASLRLARQVRQLARRIDRDEQALHQEHQELQAGHIVLQASHELLLETSPHAAALVKSAQALTGGWQHQFQTGAVGVIVLRPEKQAMGTLVLQGDFGQHIETLLEIPEEARGLWSQAMEGPLLRPAEDCFDWLFCQLELSLDLTRMQWLPLGMGGDIKGVLFFEQNYPADTQRFEGRYRQLAQAGALLLSWHLAVHAERNLAEAVLQGLDRPHSMAPADSQAERPVDTIDTLYQVLGEMAAGFAHELNNPLSVIGGRAELLAQQVRDVDTQASLELIRDNVQDMSSLVESLMGFAEPVSPRPRAWGIDDIIREAIALAQNKLGVERLDVGVDFVETDGPEVWVDSAQMVASLANLIVNAVESYRPGSGDVTIRVRLDIPGRVSLRIEDQGAGMSDEVLARAFYPFYSNKPAGRQRGMGLAFAARLIKLNGGILRLESLLGQGTTAFVELPLVD